MKKIGVLALQGAVAEHLKLLAQLPNVEAVPVKSYQELAQVDGLILPGGESTAMGKLMEYFNLTESLRHKIAAGLPTWGTCAGLILLAKTIVGQEQTYFATMDITVRRNAYGSQLDSFTTQATIEAIGKKPVPLVFIRAPYIEKVDKSVDILLELDGHIVAAKQKQMLVTSFHPELTGNPYLHEYFVNNFV